MFLSLTELEHHKIAFDVTYPPGEVSLGSDLRQEGELRATGTAELLRNTLGEIRVQGHLKANVIGVCDRCLEEARVDLDGPFDLFYRPVPEEYGHHEMRIAEGEVDLSFYEGNGLELAEVLREFVLLSLPMRLYCRENCRGICPTCGENRNMVGCKCEQKQPDARWTALREFVGGEGRE